MHKMQFNRPASLAKIDRILEMLTKRGMTVHEVSDALPLTKRNTLDYLTHLHKCGRIFIEKWVRDVDHSERMYPRPMFRAGINRDDAPKPEPLTADQRKKRAWARIKEDPDRHMTYTLKKRVKRLKLRPDRAAAWMFGAAA